MNDHLLAWLTTLDENRLARVLARRPDALAAPWPRRLDTLARRLSDTFAVMEVMRALPLPPLEILQASLVAGTRATPEGLARFLGVTQAELLPWLDDLYDQALAWPGPDGRVHLAEPVARWWTAPCGLGEPLAAYLESWTLNTEGLRRMSRALGVPAQGGRRQLVARVTAALADPDRLTAMLGEAPDGTVSLLDEFAWDGPVRGVDGNRFVAPETPEKWAADRGLLFRPQWDMAEMPREVALALRGPDYHAPFTPEPPQLGTVPVAPEAVDHAMCLAAPHAVDRAAALLENTDKTPLPLLKAGGVGVREVRRVAKETGCTEEETRLLLEVCAVARLLALDETAGGLIPTKRFDAWRLEDAPSRLRALVSAWWRMERSSLRRAAARYPTVLGDDPAGETVARVRWAVLATLATLPRDAAFASMPELVQAVHWRAPLLDRELLAECCPAVLAEARLLGLASGDTLTDLGRALASLGASAAGDEQDETVPEVERDPRLVECSVHALAGAQRTALFGADLTAVVTGPPAAELSSLLDRAADRESRGAASVWRFSPASVRRALDAGHSAESLLEELSAAGTVPQPLTYLIRDVARRHGEVTVTTVGCIIQGSDPALLAEIAAHRRLARLGLRLLAPTVLAGAAPADRTLAALREAGYAPVPVDDTGEIAVRREPQGGRLILLPGGRVAELEEAPPSIFDPPPDPHEHARRLVETRAEERQAGQTWAVIGRLATRLPTAQQSLLGFVVDRGVRALITLSDGLTATISHGELRRGVLDAWCEEAGDYLEFPLAEISSVTSG
ncbi:helicase-associated domain-containing protein [Sphaerisporangium sp. TRM90804]|uniref:helicase-associated domain-containing protein n=1 Tax=Sphaerisporangium sp. TRM90804 TaxID=3031113 RepID=UPI00244D3534|nr:helicase-associated domain-containing protein [Sphaerisporangium sp. TRM90804]MDH2424685.1 helicase-associated domain-containing protein [Sphaerisporangium sp. TRM90804]